MVESPSKKKRSERKQVDKSVSAATGHGLGASDCLDEFSSALSQCYMVTQSGSLARFYLDVTADDILVKSHHSQKVKTAIKLVQTHPKLLDKQKKTDHGDQQEPMGGMGAANDDQ